MSQPRLVAGVDCSTQATKVVVCDAETGAVLREGRAPHPDGTQVDPAEWWKAWEIASDGLLDGVEAISIGGQQHGMVLLDEAGEVVHPAVLWNDTSFRRRNGGAGLGARGPGGVGRRGGFGAGAELHGDEAAVGARCCAGCGRSGCGRRTAARLDDAPAGRGPERDLGDHDRPRRRFRHWLVVARIEQLPA